MWRAMVSTSSKNNAPMPAERHMMLARVPPQTVAMTLGTIMPIKPITPDKDTAAPVNMAVATTMRMRERCTEMPMERAVSSPNSKMSKSRDLLMSKNKPNTMMVAA